MKFPKLKPWHWVVGLGVGAYLVLRTGFRSSFTGQTEDFAPLEPEKGCSPTEKPGVAAFRAFVLKHFGGTNLGIIRACSGEGDGHMLGKAWDWGVLQNNAQVSSFLDWMLANNAEVVRRAGIIYFIYNHRIWNTRARGWQNYTGSNPHTDHVHVSFGTDGAMGRTSFFNQG